MLDDNEEDGHTAEDRNAVPNRRKAVDIDGVLAYVPITKQPKDRRIVRPRSTSHGPPQVLVFSNERPASPKAVVFEIDLNFD